MLFLTQVDRCFCCQVPLLIYPVWADVLPWGGGNTRDEQSTEKKHMLFVFLLAVEVMCNNPPTIRSIDQCKSIYPSTTRKQDRTQRKTRQNKKSTCSQSSSTSLASPACAAFIFTMPDAQHRRRPPHERASDQPGNVCDQYHSHASIPGIYHHMRQYLRRLSRAVFMLIDITTGITADITLGGSRGGGCLTI